MYCRRCGIKNPDRAIFCFDCGCKIVTPVENTQIENASTGEAVSLESVTAALPEDKPAAVQTEKPDTEVKEETDPAAQLKSELRGWGIGLIVLGILHFVLAGFLDPLWGVVIVIIGILNLVVAHRGMFILNGIALLLVGIMNIVSAVSMGGTGWAVFGIFQIIWGIQEIVKFGKYNPINLR